MSQVVLQRRNLRGQKQPKSTPLWGEISCQGSALATVHLGGDLSDVVQCTIAYARTPGKTDAGCYSRTSDLVVLRWHLDICLLASSWVTDLGTACGKLLLQSIQISLVDAKAEERQRVGKKRRAFGLILLKV